MECTSRLWEILHGWDVAALHSLSASFLFKDHRSFMFWFCFFIRRMPSWLVMHAVQLCDANVFSPVAMVVLCSFISWPVVGLHLEA